MNKKIIFLPLLLSALALPALSDDVARIGTTRYASIAEALASGTATSTQRVTLLADTSETVSIASDQILYFSEGSYSFTGVFTGSGTVNMIAEPISADPLVDSSWTGTFQLDFEYGGGPFPFSCFGNPNSTVEIMRAFNAYPAASWAGGKPGATVQPHIKLSAAWTVADGWAGADSTTYFAGLSGSANLVFKGREDGGSSDPLYFNFAVLDSYTGTLSSGSIKKRGTFIIGNIVPASTPVPGECIVKFDGNAKIASLNTTTLSGESANLVLENAGSQPGIYIPCAAIGDTVYGSLSAALASAASGDTVALTSAVSATSADPAIIPSGVTLDCSAAAFTGALGGAGRIVFTSKPATPPTFVATGDNIWTGTFVADWAGGQSTQFPANSYGISGSTVEVRRLAGGYVMGSNSNITIAPAISIPEGCTMRLDNGYSSGYMKTTTFSKLTGAGTLTIAGFKCGIQNLSNFTGVIETSSVNTPNGNYLSAPAVAIGNIVPASPALSAGDCLVKTGAGVEIENLASTTVLGQSLSGDWSLAVKTDGAQPGVYITGPVQAEIDGVLSACTESGGAFTVAVPEGTDPSAIKITGPWGHDITAGFSITVSGAQAVLSLKPVQYKAEIDPSEPLWTESGDTVALNVVLIPGLYYAAASTADLQSGFAVPAAFTQADETTVLSVPKPGASKGFYKVWARANGK